MLTAEHAAKAPVGDDGGRDVERSRRRYVPSLGVVCGQVVVLIAALIGSSELGDNSFFTHFATGKLLLHRGLGSLWNGMPDPYTFTSGGRNWIVQSWFASVLYAGADSLGGAAGVRLLTALTCAVLGALVWRLTRPASSLIPRVALCGLVLVVGAGTWSARPFMIGLVCLALTLLAAEGGLDPRWLVPVGWLWVNTHGSFPLGVVAVAAMALGQRLDGHSASRELRVLRWSVAGIAAGGLFNPVGPALLAFPVTMLTRSDVLRHVVEWQSPDFNTMWARAFLVAIVAAVVVAVRKPSYRTALPLALFVVAALVAMRNVNPALLVMLPGMAGSLAGLGSIDAAQRPPVTRVAFAALAVLIPVIVVGTCTSGGVSLRGYPVGALDWMGARGLLASDVRVAEEDYVGNLLELRFGADARTFIDDRYELHSRALVDDYTTLRDGKPGWSSVLDRYQIDVVVWRRESPLGALLLESPTWRVAYDDESAMIPPGPEHAERAAIAKAKPFIVACRPSVTRCVTNPPQG